MNLKNFFKDDLVKGSAVLFITMNIYNFLNYVFHFSMARMLGPADYGILAVLMSMVYIFGIPSEAIQTISARYTSKFNIQKENGKIRNFLFKSIKKGFWISLLSFILFIPFAYLFSKTLEISFILLIFTGILIFYSVLFPVLRGVMQGRKKFKDLGINLDLESLFKVVLALLFVFLGWKVYGAIAGLFIAGVIAFFIGLIQIKDILKSKSEKENFTGIYSYSLPFFVAMFAIVLFYSLDIILAKMFFSPGVAGKYAVISLLGKIILFGTAAIGRTMFPFTSESHESGKNTYEIFKKSLKIVLILSGTALFFYLFFPKLVIGILYGQNYIDASGILFIVGLAFTFIAIAELIILYRLSINKFNRGAYILVIFVVLEVLLLWLFHSSPIDFSIAFLGVSFLMLAYSLFLIRSEAQ